MLAFGVTIPATVPQRSEIPYRLMNYTVFVMEWKPYVPPAVTISEFYPKVFRLVSVYAALIMDFLFSKCVYRAVFIIDPDSVFCETGTEFSYTLL